MSAKAYFDLNTAKEALEWLKSKLVELEDLSLKGQEAMAKQDLDSADALTKEIHDIMEEIQKKGILIRNENATLFDFPAVIDNIPAYLCWRTEEGELMYWHYADEGFTGRKRITGKENILSYL